MTEPAPASPDPLDDSQSRVPRFDPWAGGLLLVAFLYAAFTIDRGWIPHDDGMLGQAAVRVLTGELPHRDFQDVYTGGLSYWHALSFTLFGIHLLAPRIFLLMSFAGFLLVCYGVARRFAAPRVAAGVVLLGSVWSVPNYPAAMPTWYNLFAAVLGLWCVLRFLDTERRAWLVAAGMACGVSIVVKIVGLYSLAALLIGLALVAVHERGSRGRSPLRIAVGAGLLGYLLLVVWLVRADLTPATLVHFVLPSTAMVGLGVWLVAGPQPIDGASAGLPRLLGLVAPVAIGVTWPILLLALPYVVTGSMADLIQGTLVLPFQRFTASTTTAAPLPLALSVPALAVLALAALAAAGPRSVRRGALALLAVALVAVLVLGATDAVYRGMWGGMLLTPVLVTVATLAAAAKSWRREDAGRRALEAALTAIALGTFTLVQYPFSGPVYFFYLAPLVALGALAGSSLASEGWRPPMSALAVFALLFGARWIGTADLFATARLRYEPRPALERLDLDRGHIRVTAPERTEYETLARLLRDLASGSGTAFVTPDAPEAYFLSGLRNPTPVFYDFLDDPRGRTERILAMLDREDVRVVALNRAAQISGPPAPDLVTELERRYPSAASVGRFVVRWR